MTIWKQEERIQNLKSKQLYVVCQNDHLRQIFLSHRETKEKHFLKFFFFTMKNTLRVEAIDGAVEN